MDRQNSRARHRVVAVALPSTVAFDLAIPAQVFGHPAVQDRYRFDVCTPQPGLVPTSTGFRIEVENDLALLDVADTVIVPGFHRSDPLDDSTLAALQSAVSRGARVASICIGAFALAAAGILDGRPATTHWQETDRLQHDYPRVQVRPDVLYVDTGQILTSAGLSAGIDLCIHLVRRDHGEAAALAVAQRMVVAVHRSGGQVQYARRALPEGGGLGPTREWAVTHLQRPLTLDHLARHAGMPARSFSRQFVDEVGDSPMRWLLAERIREVSRLLESTDLSVDEIAASCGFGSASTLRTHFRRSMATTPTHYRAQFRSGGSDVGG